MSRPTLLAGSLAAESVNGSGAGLGGADGREGGQHDDAAFDSWEDAIFFEWRPNQCCQSQAGARWKHRRSAEIPAGVMGMLSRSPLETQGLPKGYPRATQALPKGYTSEQYGSNTGAMPEQHRCPPLEWRSRHAPGSAVPRSARLAASWAVIPRPNYSDDLGTDLEKARLGLSGGI